MGERLKFLDSLRGIAALLVVLHHMPLIVTPNLEVPRSIRLIQMHGGTGVLLFFVISAFSLCLTMPKHEHSARPMVSYAISRLTRIAPLYYVVLAYSLVYAWVVWHTWYEPLRIATALTFTFNLFPSVAWGAVGASWTIGVEMLFYLIFPLLYLRLRTINSRIIFLFAALALSKIFILTYLPFIADEQIRLDYKGLSFFTHLQGFALGMVAFSIYRGVKSHKSATLIGKALGAAGLLSLVIIVLNPDAVPLTDAHKASPFGYFLVGVGYSMILVGLGLFPWRIVVNRVTTYYGDICYSVYLWHPPVIYLLEPTYHRVYSFDLGTPISFLICLALTVTTITVVGELSHRYIELRGLAFGQWLKAQLLAKPSPSQA
jgi:peptidoglycan/LPS O-acetylase OafA/YrhL